VLSVHDPPPEKVPPLVSDVKLTIPVGVLAVPAAVSATVAVHVVACPTMTVTGTQLTVADVDREPTAPTPGTATKNPTNTSPPTTPRRRRPTSVNPTKLAAARPSRPPEAATVDS
jgi:hypothetical protein